MIEVSLTVVVVVAAAAAVDGDGNWKKLTMGYQEGHQYLVEIRVACDDEPCQSGIDHLEGGESEDDFEVGAMGKLAFGMHCSQVEKQFQEMLESYVLAVRQQMLMMMMLKFPSNLYQRISLNYSGSIPFHYYGLPK